MRVAEWLVHTVGVHGIVEITGEQVHRANHLLVEREQIRRKIGALTDDVMLMDDGHLRGISRLRRDETD